MPRRILASGARLDPIVSPTGEPVPVTLITGFLGAGKTTLLNRILNGNQGLRIGVLVNDFGAVNIDAALISAVEENTISLTNGCVCCEIRDDLIDSLEQLLLSARGIDYVVLEASGIADPEGVVMTFLDAKYEQLLRLDGVICVVDAESAVLHRDNASLAILQLRQIGFADLIVLNKADLVGPVYVELLRNWIDSHLSRVRIIEAEHCQVPHEILLAAGRFGSVHAADLALDIGSPHETPKFDTWHYTTDTPLPESALYDAIRRLPADIYRCKGFVRTAERPTERILVQSVGRRVSTQSCGTWNERGARTDLVLIGAKGSVDPEYLESLFDGCHKRLG